MDVIGTIKEYGDLFYFVTIVWTFLEGETFVLFAGFAARQGWLNLELLIASAWLGSFLGDQCYFAIGRLYGVRLLARFPRWRPGVAKALGWLAKYDTIFVLSYRFIYGVRNFSSFALGMSPITWRRFLILNFIAAGVWATTFSVIGYTFGTVLDKALGDLHIAVGVALLLVFVIAALVALRMSRKRQPVAEEDTGVLEALPVEARGEGERPN